MIGLPWVQMALVALAGWVNREVIKRERLSGLLNSYQRRAA